jgi:hypothetical protein
VIAASYGFSIAALGMLLASNNAPLLRELAARPLRPGFFSTATARQRAHHLPEAAGRLPFRILAGYTAAFIIL